MKISTIFGLGAVRGFGDMEKTSIGIPQIGTDVTMKCEGKKMVKNTQKQLNWFKGVVV